MRSYDASDEDDRKELAKLNAEPWMAECLAMNPEYVHWGPHEDYMATKGDGWNSPKSFPTWKTFGPWALDELNELVHFYFSVGRAAEECAACGGACYNPGTKKIADAFYAHGSGAGKRWCDDITQDEADALAEAGRVPSGTTAATINAANRIPGMFGLSHYGINRCILVEARARRLGVWGYCPVCGGEGHVYTEPTGHLELVLWWLHPRKGASRGIDIDRIERDDLPAVLAFLENARVRNAQRFGKVRQAYAKLTGTAV